MVSVSGSDEKEHATPLTFNTYAASHDPDWWKKDPEYRRKFREDYMRAQGDPSFVQPDREFVEALRQAFNYAQTVEAGHYAKLQGATIDNPLGTSLAKIQPVDLQLAGLTPTGRTAQAANLSPDPNVLPNETSNGSINRLEPQCHQKDDSNENSKYVGMTPASGAAETETPVSGPQIIHHEEPASLSASENIPAPTSPTAFQGFVGDASPDAQIAQLRTIPDGSKISSPAIPQDDIAATETPVSGPQTSYNHNEPVSLSAGPENIPAPSPSMGLQGLIGDAAPDAQMAQLRALPAGNPAMQISAAFDPRTMPSDFDLSYEPRAINADYQSEMIPAGLEISPPAIPQNDIAAVAATETPVSGPQIIHHEEPVSLSAGSENIPAPPPSTELQGLVGDAAPDAQMAQLRALPAGNPAMQISVAFDPRTMPGEFDLSYEPRAMNADYQSQMIPAPLESSSPAGDSRRNMLLTQQLANVRADFVKIQTQTKKALQGTTAQPTRATLVRDVDARYTAYLQGIQTRIRKGQLDQNTPIMTIEKYIKSAYHDGANVWKNYIGQSVNSRPAQNGQPSALRQSSASKQPSALKQPPATKLQSDPLPYIKTDKYTQEQWNAARQLSDRKKGPGTALIDLYRNHKIKVGDPLSVMLTDRYNRAHNTKYTPQAFYNKFVHY